VGEIIGSSANSTKGAAGETTSNLYTSRYIPNIVMADGPAGIRITAKYKNYTAVTADDGFDSTKKYYTTNDIDTAVEVTSITNEATYKAYFEQKDADGNSPALYATDDTTYYQYCTAFPIGTMLAMTWNPDLIEEVGRAIQTEMLEYGVTSYLAPGMNIHRNPLCGRNFEYYSEDPVIAGTIAAAETKGVQTDENGNKTGVGVTLKHFAFNNQESNRFNNNSVMSERAAREIYLKGFQIAVETAQPDYIMSSYNSINGTQTFLNYGLLTEILRNEWGFKGFVMTDWNSMDNAYAGRRGLLYGSMTDAFKKVAQPEGTLTYTDFDVCARAQLMYAGNDSEMPGAANYGVTSPNTALVYKALNSNIVDENGDSYMRLGDLQRNAINILNVILDTEIFQTDIYAKTSTYYLLKKANNDNASAETTITDLTTELDQTKEDLKQAQDDLEQAKTEQNALDQKVSDLQKQIEDLKAAGNKNEGSDANKAAAQKELEQAKADLKQAQADKAALNEKAESLQNSVDELTFASKTASVKSAKSKSAKTLKIALKSVADAEKYEITYATNKKFKGSKTVTVSKTSAVIKKLKSKKTYYVKVRAVKTVGGKTVKTGYSAVKKVKVK
jgi:predicted  nucleic acid-binding Zn-ribbon protein